MEDSHPSCKGARGMRMSRMAMTMPVVFLMAVGPESMAGKLGGGPIAE